MLSLISFLLILSIIFIIIIHLIIHIIFMKLNKEMKGAEYSFQTERWKVEESLVNMSDARRNDKGDEKAQVERGMLMVFASKNQQ